MTLGVGDGLEALVYFTNQWFDLVLLGDILTLIARDDAIDPPLGLEIGADDYLIEPHIKGVSQLLASSQNV